MASALLLLLLAFAQTSLAIGPLPPMWARGGKLYEKLKLQQEQRAKGALGASGGAGASSSSSSSSSFPMGNVSSQPLDHFNASEPRTIDIRYWIDASCYETGGPVFVHMGGEGAAGPASCDTRAKTHKALVLAVEHRFYGKSVVPHAEGDAPLSRALLEFLTVEQNLADTVSILRLAQQKYGAGAGFSFGGSYSGATCAWFRLSYPDDVAGCISLSGVVNAILNYTQFDDQVRDALGVPGFSPGCAEKAEKAMRAFDRLFAQGNDTKRAIKASFNASNLIGTPTGDPDFMYAVADGFAMMDQYGSKQDLCDHLQLLPSDATDAQRVENAGGVIAHHYGFDFVSGCFYDAQCIKAKTKGEGFGVGDRQWRWQKCTQVAYLQAAPTTLPIRSRLLTLDALLHQCEVMFGAGTTPNTAELNTKFGGSHPNGSNVFFINYSDDPWLRASVTESLPGLPACMTTCNGCGHCGAGVPPGVGDKCDSEADELVEKWLKMHTS